MQPGFLWTGEIAIEKNTFRLVKTNQFVPPLVIKVFLRSMDLPSPFLLSQLKFFVSIKHSSISRLSDY
jgi:hypothetical protein